MKSAPLIPASEFSTYIVSSEEHDGVSSVERCHPEFGTWKERWIDLGNIRIFEHQARITRRLNVFYEEEKKDCVHHCMSLQGVTDANFMEWEIEAQLNPMSFHSLFMPYNEYSFGVDSQITTIHLEVKKDHYMGFLSDSEKWSSELKNKLAVDELYYSGELRLSATMVQTIHSIFNSPLNGSLKKLLIESRIHELIALQLHESQVPGRKEVNTADLFHHIRSYLDKSFLEPLTLKGIARQFAVNEFSLKKGFRDHFNSTVFDYVLSKRLEHGQQLLVRGEQSIQEISSIVGYKYANHFSTAFKRRFGINPTDARN